MPLPWTQGSNLNMSMKTTEGPLRQTGAEMKNVMENVPLRLQQHLLRIRGCSKEKKKKKKKKRKRRGFKVIQSHTSSATDQAIASELQSYLQEMLDAEEDPLKWWTESQRTPSAFKTGKKSLCIPATSSSSEGSLVQVETMFFWLETF
ncbi:hypothetical protein FQN60_009302, partial [Etheostoma spectabile]